MNQKGLGLVKYLPSAVSLLATHLSIHHQKSFSVIVFQQNVGTPT